MSACDEVDSAPPESDAEPGTAGYSTAELLGNAALAVGALVVIWAGLQGLGDSVIDWIGSQLMGG